MRTDRVVIVSRRELQDALRDRAFLIRSALSLLAFPVFTAVLELRSPIAFFVATGIPTLLTAGIIGGALTWSITLESFVGERDRKTLETLLATPLSALEIFAGKAACNAVLAVVYAVVTFVLVALAGRLVSIARGVAYPASSADVVRMFLVVVFITMVMVAALIILSSQSRSMRAAQALLVFPLMLVYLPSLIWGAKLVSLPIFEFATVLALLLGLLLLLVTVGSRLFRPEHLLLDGS
jgi:ABC-type Na+ efflux pump permease subunit